MKSSPSLITRIASRYGVESSKFYDTLKSTAFRQRDGSVPTNEHMMTLLIVADQYGLNPFCREIYAFPDNNNGIIPVVGVDGWSRILNDHCISSDQTETDSCSPYQVKRPGLAKLGNNA